LEVWRDECSLLEAQFGTCTESVVLLFIVCCFSL